MIGVWLGALGICLLCVAIIFFIVTGIQAVNLRYFENIPTVITVDGIEVYRGISGCASVKSTGATTLVEINGGWLCFIPVAKYVSNNVVVRGLRP